MGTDNAYPYQNIYPFQAWPAFCDIDSHGKWSCLFSAVLSPIWRRNWNTCLPNFHQIRTKCRWYEYFPTSCCLADSWARLISPFSGYHFRFGYDCIPNIGNLESICTDSMIHFAKLIHPCFNTFIHGQKILAILSKRGKYAV